MPPTQSARAKQRQLPLRPAGERTDRAGVESRGHRPEAAPALWGRIERDIVDLARLVPLSRRREHPSYPSAWATTRTTPSWGSCSISSGCGNGLDRSFTRRQTKRVRRAGTKPCDVQRLQPLTERHRSRTCLASGYDAVLVLKVCRVKDSWLLKAPFCEPLQCTEILPSALRSVQSSVQRCAPRIELSARRVCCRRC